MSVAASTTRAPTQSSPASVRRRGAPWRRAARSVTSRTVVERDRTAWPASLGRWPRSRWWSALAPAAAEPAVEEARSDVETFGPARYLNRELSWLEFAARLLDIAGDETLPLLERAKFLAIFSTGLDEFFQVRVAGLKNQLDAGRRERFPDGRSVLETLEAVREQVDGPRRDRTRGSSTTPSGPGCPAAGIEIVD